jgi:hypothetical protein
MYVGPIPLQKNMMIRTIVVPVLAPLQPITLYLINVSDQDAMVDFPQSITATVVGDSASRTISLIQGPTMAGAPIKEPVESMLEKRQFEFTATH